MSNGYFNGCQARGSHYSSRINCISAEQTILLVLTISLIHLIRYVQHPNCSPAITNDSGLKNIKLKDS